MSNISAQWYFHAVEFKNENQYKLSNPNSLLEAKAVKKRKLKGIEINGLDFPIPKEKINAIQDAGFELVYKSRWLNTIIVVSKSPIIPDFDIVKRTWLVDTMSNNKWPINQNLALDSSKIITVPIEGNRKYGASESIINFLGLKGLHQKGYTGNGVDVIVFDGGFSNVHRLSVFDSLRVNNRFWFYRDMSQNSTNIFAAGQHGTQVLSCMAANLSGTYIGTGFGANYGIIATETGDFESPLEEWAWIQGVEEASALGADLIQCSLGYTRFDNEEFDHQSSDLGILDWPMFKVAKIASDKGLVLVNSAGNEGDGNWKYMGFPSGSPDVFSVAAAFPNGEIADFSSHGFEKGAQKPDVAAIGVRTPCIGAAGYVVGATGTSFSAPCLAGALTCLIQLYPNQSTIFYKEMLRAISSHSMVHSTRSGYGIPNFSLALNYSIPNSKMPFYSNQSNLDTLYSGQEIKTFRKSSKKYKLKLTNCQNSKTKASVSFNLINNLCTGAVLPNMSEGEYEMAIKQGLRKWKKKIYFVSSNGIDIK